MTILKIKITNLLSFDDVEINGLHDMNCIVGRNNVGKSNLLKALKFYYNRLEGCGFLQGEICLGQEETCSP
ncbi:AAA family ATPase [Yersinia mollaretii]|uniref:AAA family ATPase n=1 Tax=Yersinia mollaretii TaxID=33060 RepID=UPI0021BD2158|nr:AAA family ATPase [Yersinia mollaretii]